MLKILTMLMGATGSGKGLVRKPSILCSRTLTDQHSPLVNKICGREIADVGEGQYVIIVNGETITSIDTPGFDDTYLSDGEVLERIAMSLFTQ